MVNKRFNHVLKDNKGNGYPEHFIFFDTETLQIPIGNETYEHRLRLGVACHWRWRKDGVTPKKEYKEFKTQKVFWDWLDNHTQERKRMILIAHNLQFDMKVMAGFEHLKRRGWKAHKMILNGTTNIWEFRNGRKTIMCLDNMNYFSTSLAKLGESIGIDKLDMPTEDVSDKEWFVYCRRDVEVMVEAWDRWLTFLRDNDLGNFAKTVASQAFNAFRHRFMPVPIHIHDNEDATTLERQSYYGGRTEAFFIGKLPERDYYSLDVNSMYPYVMKQFEYPYKLINMVNNPSIGYVEELLQSYCITAEVDLNTKRRMFPTRFDDKLIFPIGRFRTTLSTEEVKRALEAGEVEQFLKVAIYEKAVLFDEYVDFFYQRRNEYKEQGNDAFQFMTKIMLNSLYGKFGQKNEVYEKIGYDESLEDSIVQEWDYEQCKLVRYRTISGLVEEFVGFREGANSFPAIPAHITANARLLLWDYMLVAGLRNVFYMDTDSIFTNALGKKRLAEHIHATKLGELDIQEHSTNLEIFGLKDYKFGDKVKIKGVRKDAEQVSARTFRQLRFEGLRSSIREGRTNRMLMRYEYKTLKREYNKGIVQPSGRVSPHKLQNHYLDNIDNNK